MVLQVRHLYAAPPEWDLAEFYVAHEKFAECESLLRRLLEEQTSKLPDKDPGFIRTHLLWASVHNGQQRYHDCISSANKALGLLLVWE